MIGIQATHVAYFRRFPSPRYTVWSKLKGPPIEFRRKPGPINVQALRRAAPIGRAFLAGLRVERNRATHLHFRALKRLPAVQQTW